MSDPPRPADPATEQLSFEEIAARLESIATRLEQGDTALEEALGLFEEGVRLARLGTERLDRAERRIEQLLQGDAVAPLDVDRPQASKSGADAPGASPNERPR